MKITKLLVANRGEIACRIFETTRRLGITGIAVYSDADANARHVERADVAVRIGRSPASESYLDFDAVLSAARASGADAVHPGYGFLSENADFAQACVDAGFIFVGPRPETIRDMAEKDRAKVLMEAAGVDVIPGDKGSDQSPDALQAAGHKVGYPLLIKAVAGGGGRGMRAVHEPEGFMAALEAAKREAKGAFGDERMLLEKLLTPTRHLEVQIFGDQDGDVVHLFERDCSIQRRHQKIVEEAPAPFLTEALRARLGGAAVKAAKAIGYQGAGTVEFLLDASPGADAFYFMEMNTRLQVEHPVSEMVTGVDLVEWQLRVASGEPLPLAQDEIELRGHSIEVRICAEDPGNDFLPTAGRIDYLGTPSAKRSLRIETGVRQGDEVSVYYDSMLAKLVVWGKDREAARTRLYRALGRYHVAGLATNLSFLSRIVAHDGFASGAFDNTFVEANQQTLLGAADLAPDEILAVASLDSVLSRARRSEARATRAGDPGSPWAATDAWRLNAASPEILHFILEGEPRETTVRMTGAESYVVNVDSVEVVVSGSSRNWDEVDQGRATAHEFSAVMRGRTIRARSVAHGNSLTFFIAGETYRLSSRGLASSAVEETVSAGAVLTPMPGKIIEVLVAAGDSVETGQAMVVLEAMKMEHTVRANAAAVIEEILVAAGDQVDDGAALLVLAEPSDESG